MRVAVDLAVAFVYPLIRLATVQPAQSIIYLHFLFCQYTM